MRMKFAPTMQKSRVPTSEYYQHVPSTSTPIHVDKANPCGLGIDEYNFPKINEGITTPSIPDYTIGYVVRAPALKAYYSYGDKKWQRIVNHKPDLLQFVNKNTQTSWQWNVDESQAAPCTIGLFVDAEKLRSTAISTFDKDIADLEIPSSPDIDDSLIKQLILSLKNEAAYDPLLTSLYAQTAAQFLNIHLLRNHCTYNFKLYDTQSGLNRIELARVIEYIESNLAREISLDKLARLTRMSPYHFARRFKISMNISPHQYVITRRMETARRLLKTTSMSILDVCTQVGYENQSHFTLLFKRFYGVPPGEYRRNL